MRIPASVAARVYKQMTEAKKEKENLDDCRKRRNAQKIFAFETVSREGEFWQKRGKKTKLR